MAENEEDFMKEYLTEGFHGTSKDSALSISDNNFQISRGEEHWLGEGAYFFENGISDGLENAKEWGQVESWDNSSQKHKYEFYGVVKAKIHFESLWDLTSKEGLELFERLRKVLGKRGVKRSEACSGRKFDNSVVEFAASKMNFDGLKCWFFIKLNKDSRRYRVKPGIPNVTVLCVREPSKCISIDNVDVVVEGFVSK